MRASQPLRYAQRSTHNQIRAAAGTCPRLRCPLLPARALSLPLLGQNPHRTCGNFKEGPFSDGSIFLTITKIELNSCRRTGIFFTSNVLWKLLSIIWDHAIGQGDGNDDIATNSDATKGVNLCACDCRNGEGAFRAGGHYTFGGRGASEPLDVDFGHHWHDRQLS